jgi:hypothetical protein
VITGDDGYGSFSTMIKAVSWAMQRAEKNGRPSVISMSITGGYYKPMDDIIDAAVEAGIVVVTAAGNGKADACNFTPASAKNAITVGATTSNDEVSYFSNHGECVDVYAPGSRIVSVDADSKTGYASYSGTSMACPHVSGIVALMLEANPTLTPSQIRSSLLCLSEPDLLNTVEKNTWEDSSLRFLAQVPSGVNFVVANEFTDEACNPPDRTSSRTCEELGWANARMHGDKTVCGESDLALGGCSGFLTFTAAQGFCEDAGARLCSKTELQNDEARATGCSYDAKFIWSSDSCANGEHAMALGASWAGTAEGCAASSEQHNVRCCADSETPSISSSSCNELGWTNSVNFGNPNTCGESDDALGGCSGLLSWDAANAFCAAGGARMCTSVELLNDETRATGCSLDAEMIWSNSECALGHSRYIGSSLFGSGSDCKADGSLSHVRCCADHQIEISSKSCSELKWTNAERFGSASVCGESLLGLGGCSAWLEWADANAFCKAGGARLCTSNELQSDEARGTGCQFDSQFLWSSTPCVDGYSTAAGSSAFNKNVRCPSAGSKRNTRCCADVW